MSSEAPLPLSGGSALDERCEGLPDERAVRTALRLWVTLARAHAVIAARDQRSLDRHKLSRGEFGVLDALFFKGPLLLGDLQRKILVSSGGITYLVDRLEERGLVERRPSPDDRRAAHAALTPEGESFYRQIFPRHARGLAASASALDQEEQVQLTRLLKKLGTGAAKTPEAEVGE